MIYKHIMKAAAIIIGLFVITTTHSLAEQLSGKQIERLIRDRTVKLSTPFGIELPLFYSNNGVVKGDVSGMSAASLFAPKEQGKWWINDNTMCQQWPSWYNGKRFCFEITKLGENKIKWLRDDGASGTATIVR